MAKYDDPILASEVDFTIQVGNSPLDKETPITYSASAFAKASTNNAGHDSFTRKRGKYLGHSYPRYKDIVYEYMVSVDAQGNQLIDNHHYICLPCPDFCGTADVKKKEE